MKLSLIQSIGLIAKAINTCVHKQGYVFTRKQELMGIMMVCVASVASVETLDDDEPFISINAYRIALLA